LLSLALAFSQLLLNIWPSKKLSNRVSDSH
jgi:hypothetical protein